MPIIEKLKTRAPIWTSDLASVRLALQEGAAGKIQFLEANLAGEDLHGIDLTGVDLRRSDLTGCDLTDANLTDANLQGADLTGANLTDAILTRTDFRGATLNNVTMSGADFSSSYMQGAAVVVADDALGIGIQPVMTDPILYANATIPAGNTVANTAAATALGSSFTIPAGTLRVGDHLRFRGFGIYSGGGLLPDLTFILKLGSTALISIPLGDPGGTDVPFAFEATAVVVTAGAASVIYPAAVAQAGLGVLNSSLGGPDPVEDIDTTADQVVTIEADWGAAHADSTVTLQMFTAELLRQ